MARARSPRSSTVPVLFIDAPWPAEQDHGATEVSSEWAQQAIRSLVEYNQAKRQYEITLLCGEDATRTNISNALQRTKRRKGLVVFYGHGCRCGESLYESQLGLRWTVLAALDPINHRLLQKKIVYAVACHSAKALGEYVLKEGTVSYIGFDDTIMLPASHKGVSALGEAVNTGLMLLTQRNVTCIEAHSSIYRHLDSAVLDCLKVCTQDNIITAWALSLSRDALAPPEKIGRQSARLR